MASTYSLRVASLQDEGAVTTLLEASYRRQLAGSYPPETLEKALPLMTKANPRLLASGTYYVAETKGQLVGCGGWSMEAPGNGEQRQGTAHIRHVATHPDWLRRGIGRALLARCFHEAAAAGIGRLECLSTLVAVDFYLAAGFHVVGPMAMKLRGDVSIDGMLLHRKLAAASAPYPS